jgi:[acyl-carrier-protein] S-malonyltransferase
LPVFFLQPAIYVTSLAAVEVLRAREEGQLVIDSIDVTCGLSLGEYTALAFAGAFRYFPCSVNESSI